MDKFGISAEEAFEKLESKLKLEISPDILLNEPHKVFPDEEE